jgi:hypothetical protein
LIYENVDRSPTSYLRNGSDIYYVGINSFTNEGYSSILPAADAVSFVPIYSQPPSTRLSFGKDGKNVFFDNELIPAADPATFEIVELSSGVPTEYQKDKNTVYFCGDDCNPVITGGGIPAPVSGADPATFDSLPGAQFTSFAGDHEHVYYYGKIVYGADPKTFALLCVPGSVYGAVCLFAKDEKKVYVITDFVGGIEPLADADPSTFTLANLVLCGPECPFAAQDNRHKYDLYGNVVKDELPVLPVTN